MAFQFRPVLSIAALAGVAVLVSLGAWQLRRLEWKRDLIERVEMRADAAPIPFDDAMRRHAPELGEDMSYAPVRARGRFRHDLEVHVFGTLDGAPGYYVFTPLERENMRAIYVNRGFVPQA